MQKLLGVLDINRELELDAAHNNLPKDERRSKYQELLDDKGELHRELENTETKELLWFLAGHGPYRTYLKRFNIVATDECRLCRSKSAESPEHLLKECEATRRVMPEDENDLDQVEETVQRIVLELYRIERQGGLDTE